MNLDLFLKKINTACIILIVHVEDFFFNYCEIYSS